MRYRELGSTGVQVSEIGLGGHEFGPNDHIRGFQDDGKLAVTRGHIFPGFGEENRKAIVHQALDLGINLFDVTIDSEKEAMGRLLEDIGGADDIIIQTRPEGMVYGYDPANRQMADGDLLRTEVERICRLLRRDHIDILNLAFMQDALDADTHYLNKIGQNIRSLKQAGLIRFASADTFSGRDTYLTQYRSGHFDATFVNYNIVDDFVDQAVIQPAFDTGIGILAREPFRKAQLFAMAEDAGFSDRAAVAGMSMRWILTNQHVASVVTGVASAEQLLSNYHAIEAADRSDFDTSMIEAIRGTRRFTEDRSSRKEMFTQ